MPSFHEYRRRAILPFIGLLLAAYYLLVFLPLSKRAEAIDKPLETSWRKLAASLGRTNALSLDLQHIEKELEATRHALAALDAAEQRTVARLQPGDGLKVRMSAPFRLVDYQNELSQHADEVGRKAVLRSTQVAPAVYDGFPQHRMEITEPTLLWAALRAAEDAVDTALACGVSAIHSLEVPVTFTNTPSLEPASRWVEIPVIIEFTATTASAAQVLESLALRAEELKASTLPETSSEKSVLFIDRLLIKRQTTEKTDEVRIWLKAIGFAMRE